MIEPPKTPEECAAIFELAGFRVNFQFAENVYLANGAKMAEILNELEALRAIVKELAASQMQNDDGRCVLCGGFYGEHEADCLIERAKRLVKA
jgi:hypothetical protein